MQNNTLRTNTLVLSQQALCGISLVCFLAQDAFRVVIATLLPFLPYKYVTFFLIVMMYAPLILSFCLKKKGHYGYLGRFFICFLLVGLIFFVTYCLHPEYKDWYFAGSYPIWERIFRPNQFLYAFLFVSAIEDPKDLLKYLKLAAYILLVYYSYRLLKAQIQGYWLTTTTSAGQVRSEYDLSYGYDHLFVFSVFCCYGFRERKLHNFILSGISLIEILMGGSRGPLLGVVLMLVIMYFLYRKSLSRWIQALILVTVVLVTLLYLVLGMEGFLILVGSMFKQLGISSRTIDKMLSGSDALDGTGRDRLYGIAIDMIKEGFWGYGAYGDRYVIGKVFWVGYAHNIVLEMLIDFGWILGTAICVKILFDCVRMIFFCRDQAWRDAFIVFMIPCTKLLLSGSFWFSEAFFACIAIQLTYSKWEKQKRKELMR